MEADDRDSSSTKSIKFYKSNIVIKLAHFPEREQNIPDNMIEQGTMENTEKKKVINLKITNHRDN